MPKFKGAPVAANARRPPPSKRDLAEKAEQQAFDEAYAQAELAYKLVVERRARRKDAKAAAKGAGGAASSWLGSLIGGAGDADDDDDDDDDDGATLESILSRLLPGPETGPPPGHPNYDRWHRYRREWGHPPTQGNSLYYSGVGASHRSSATDSNRSCCSSTRQGFSEPPANTPGAIRRWRSDYMREPPLHVEYSPTPAEYKAEMAAKYAEWQEGLAVIDESEEVAAASQLYRLDYGYMAPLGKMPVPGEEQLKARAEERFQRHMAERRQQWESHRASAAAAAAAKAATEQAELDAASVRGEAPAPSPSAKSKLRLKAAVGAEVAPQKPRCGFAGLVSAAGAGGPSEWSRTEAAKRGTMFGTYNAGGAVGADSAGADEAGATSADERQAWQEASDASDERQKLAAAQALRKVKGTKVLGWRLGQ